MSKSKQQFEHNLKKQKRIAQFEREQRKELTDLFKAFGEIYKPIKK